MCMTYGRSCQGYRVANTTEDSSSSFWVMIAKYQLSVCIKRGRLGRHGRERLVIIISSSSSSNSQGSSNRSSKGINSKGSSSSSTALSPASVLAASSWPLVQGRHKKYINSSSKPSSKPSSSSSSSSRSSAAGTAGRSG